MKFFKKPERRRFPRTQPTVRVRLEVESLEVRIVPTYVVSGNAWPHPELVTISFVPDGTIVGTNAQGYVYSNLFAKMNARFGSPAVWEAQILSAAQSWAVQTNLNFDVVADNGTPIGQGAYQQGDPGMGDIRVSGYGFSSNYLASTWLPPPANNFSLAGDMQFNTNLSWHIGSTYDLFTVAAHEMGHAVGLLHSTTPSAEMYASYNGVKSSLTSDDIAGVRAIYSCGNPRTADASSNNSIATATDISSLISTSTYTALAPTTDLVTTSDVDYYTFTAPTGSSSNLTVAVQSAGLSMLTPAVTVYASDGVTVLGSASDSGHLGGNTLTISITGVTSGEQFYVKVAGADSTVFSIGEYALSLNLGTGSLPTVPLPNTETLDGTIQQSGGGQPETGYGAAANPVSTLLGTTRDLTSGLARGSADVFATTLAADGALDRLVLQGNGTNPSAAVPGRVVTVPGSSFVVGQTLPNLWTSATAPLALPVQPTWNTQPGNDAMGIERAITRFFAQEDQQSSGATDLHAADAGAPDTGAPDASDSAGADAGPVDTLAPILESGDLFAGDEMN